MRERYIDYRLELVWENFEQSLETYNADQSNENLADLSICVWAVNDFFRNYERDTLIRMVKRINKLRSELALVQQEFLEVYKLTKLPKELIDEFVPAHFVEEDL
jgi:hypothetical protein